MSAMMYLAVFASIFAGGIISGLGLGAYQRRRQFVHHHAWGQWEGCELLRSRWSSGREVDYLVPGQKRDCLGCGEREVRNIIANETH